MGERKMDEPYGDSPEDKGENTTCIMFLNIRGLPFHNAAPKIGKLGPLVRINNVDILGLAKVNINWKNIPFICTGYMNELCHGGRVGELPQQTIPMTRAKPAINGGFGNV